MSDPTTADGTARRVRLLALRPHPLDPAAVLAAVQDPLAGGVNLFVGAVRDHDHGHDVGRLEYTAHPRALGELRAVAEEVAGEFDVVAVAAEHRVGTLQIGDAAVALAVSAVHRAEAYDASRALIDRLKARVPIWKHQIFADGSDEWVGTP